MDVQSSDGKGMILKYVTSYVSKWHDAYSNDALFSLLVGPYQAAYREGNMGGSEHRNTAKKINEHRITARKVNETPSPQVRNTYF